MEEGKKREAGRLRQPITTHRGTAQVDYGMLERSGLGGKIRAHEVYAADKRIIIGKKLFIPQLKAIFCCSSPCSSPEQPVARGLRLGVVLFAWFSHSIESENVRELDENE